MNDREKVKFMYEAVYGWMETATSAHIEVVDEYCDEKDGYKVLVRCTKDGNLCWEMSREDVLFDYITRDIDLR